MMQTTTETIQHKYFIESFGCDTCPGRQYQVRFGKVEEEIKVKDKTYIKIRLRDQPSKVYQVNAKFAYDTLDEAGHKANSLLEADGLRAKSILDTSINLLKFN